MDPLKGLTRAAIEHALLVGFIAARGAKLRKEEETKVDEVLAFLREVDRSVRAVSRKQPVTIVDAAAGKGYLGLLACKFVLEPLDREGSLVLIERNQRLLDAALGAAERLKVTQAVQAVPADVQDLAAWPANASVVLALHACGDAADRIIESAIAAGARQLLVVPCCVSKSTRGAALAEAVAGVVQLPRVAPIQRRLIHAVIDGERVLRLESAGYHCEAVEFVSASVTPWNVLLRARRVDEPTRRKRAQASLERLRGLGHVS